MTEEDTFNALRRIPFITLRSKIPERISHIELQILLKQHGWKVTEYWKEISKLQKSRYD